uniref:Uncharacterized protein n=1 Tax=Knipowitschia caucasica TaxID=637954 RepID=A0AAV2JWX1_KNICA
MAEGDKRRTPSREVPSTGKMYKTLLETRMANLRLRECSAREGRMYPFGGLDGGTDARRTLGGPINSHQAAGARPKTGLLSGPSSSTTSGRSMLPYVVGSRTEKAKMVPTLLFGSRETSHRGDQTSSLEKNRKRGSIRESPKTTYGTGDLRYDFEPQGTVIRAQIDFDFLPWPE